LTLSDISADIDTFQQLSTHCLLSPESSNGEAMSGGNKPENISVLNIQDLLNNHLSFNKF